MWSIVAFLKTAFLFLLLQGAEAVTQKCSAKKYIAKIQQNSQEDTVSIKLQASIFKNTFL